MVKVSTRGLREAAHDYRVCAGQLAIAAKHHREASWLEYADRSILGEFGSAHEVFTRDVQRWLEDMAAALSSWGHALDRAASAYEAGSADAARLLESESEAER